MNAFFNYFYELMIWIGGRLWLIIAAIGQAVTGIFNIKYYKALLDSYREKFGVGGWVMAIIAHILILIILIMAIYLIYCFLRKVAIMKMPLKENEELKDEVVKLKHEMYKLQYEKDKILAMQVANLGLEVDKNFIDEEQEPAKEGEQPNEEIDTSKFRFGRLVGVDYYYNSDKYKKPTYNDDINLEDFCKDFRNFAASQLGLYYDLNLLKFFVASLGATKLIILQGISGTGKTSLAYAFGQFVCNPSVICPVQPAWRDRSELFGYFNEFTKRFNETEFLKTIYEANYYEDPRLIVLDEMNIARVEYYFAEMLSILEMPRVEDRLVEIVSAEWPDDPQKLKQGKLFIAPNIWYIGTINNDDSTFAVSDKVYDRAIPIDLDAKANRFDAPMTAPLNIRYDHLNGMFEKAKREYTISQENLAKLEEVDNYIIKHFRITFGNRILKQIKEFVPCYVACGGSEINGIDFMLCVKILRKFQSLNLGYIRDEMDGFIAYLNELFGYDNMILSKEYLERIKKLV